MYNKCLKDYNRIVVVYIYVIDCDISAEKYQKKTNLNFWIDAFLLHIEIDQMHFRQFYKMFFKHFLCFSFIFWLKKDATCFGMDGFDWICEGTPRALNAHWLSY